eukprot:c766_g1_i1.p1 GENE.c766_g1_i1~~c766_g1_i1.p1  ORF type:complete len:302 (+),score=70.44 c766_g1_i1:36-941(+)
MSAQKVENWADESPNWDQEPTRAAPAPAPARETRPPRQYQTEHVERERREFQDLPVPENPPFVAYIGNLAFDTNNAEVIKFFENACKVKSVHLVHDFERQRLKGHGYVEFGDRESLEKALTANGATFCNRPIRVNVADQKYAPKQRQAPPPQTSEADTGVWRRGDVLPSRPDRPEGDVRESAGRGRGGGRGGRGGGRGGNDNSERPRIQLQPRSTPAPAPQSDSQHSQPQQQEWTEKKRDPFGGAKPRDEKVFHKDADKQTHTEKPKTATPTKATPTKETTVGSRNRFAALDDQNDDNDDE